MEYLSYEHNLHIPLALYFVSYSQLPISIIPIKLEAPWVGSQKRHQTIEIHGFSLSCRECGEYDAEEIETYGGVGT